MTDGQGYYEYNGERYSKSEYYWRKVEPIKWRYLSEVSAGVGEFISEYAFHGVPYKSTDENYEDGTYASNYEKSNPRRWLNDDFFNQAFFYDKSLVQTATVDNSASLTKGYDSGYDVGVCENTEDKIYLPSYRDVTNPNYGFYSQDEADDNRIAYDPYGNQWIWWTRSPVNHNCVSMVDENGRIGIYSVNSGGSVRPCAQLIIA